MEGSVLWKKLKGCFFSFKVILSNIRSLVTGCIDKKVLFDYNSCTKMYLSTAVFLYIA